MIAIKTLSLAIGIAVATSSFAFAQQGNAAANEPSNPLPMRLQVVALGRIKTV